MSSYQTQLYGVLSVVDDKLAELQFSTLQSAPVLQVGCLLPQTGVRIDEAPPS